MKRHVTGPPDKSSAVISGIFGVIFVLIGIFVVIPSSGLFGLLWTAAALVFTVSNFRHIFPKKSAGPNPHTGQEERTPPPVSRDAGSAPARPTNQLDREGRLDQLKRLKEAGLLSDEEYRAKRDEILGRR